MRDRPIAHELLEAAQAVLSDTLLPALPQELTYQARMVLNAIGIAARQAAAGQAPLEAARHRLAALYGDDGSELSVLERRLASDIRAGRFDPGSADRAAVFAHLWATTRAKAAESSPKALRERTE
ncbi:DUF6285 domain-containing protein [Hyalangium gracile]|uniref:DUF6285 domain-containing protein n=1 Tax=Hyalangium gracile TaxID=394092 RepID=UPI001CC8FF90|nr:DUF6285 domain-containing protein [Hyalangium gracile]